MKELKKHFDEINDFELQIAVTEVIEDDYETEEVDVIDKNIYFEVANEKSYKEVLNIVNTFKKHYKENKYYLKISGLFYNCKTDKEVHYKIL